MDEEECKKTAASFVRLIASLTAAGRSARHVLTGIVGRRGARVKVAGAAVESTACAGKTAASDRTSARNRAFIDLETLNLIG
jgi:hypothetical protein